MSKFSSSRIARGVAAALLGVSLAGPALAEHDDWYGRGRDRGYPVHRHGEYCDHDHARDRGRHDGYWGRWQRDRHPRYREERRYYGCRPCRRRFDDRDRFYGHLRHEHGVPAYFAPRVIVRADWGWMFGG